MTGKAAVRGLELRLIFFGLDAAGREDEAGTQECRNREVPCQHYFQPFNKLPSNQSHNT